MTDGKTLALFPSKWQLVPSVLHTVLREDKWESHFSVQRVKNPRDICNIICSIPSIFFNLYVQLMSVLCPELQHLMGVT